MSDSVKIALIQRACSDDVGVNIAGALGAVEEAASRGAQFVVLPELFASRYFCQTEDAALFDLAESIPGPITSATAELARRLDITILASVFEKRAAGIYHNTACVVTADGDLSRLYRKMHIPDDPGYYEKFYFTPGDIGFVAHQSPHVTVGPLICWDQWYPEAARLTALRGAQILCYPTAIGWLPEDKQELGEEQLAAWQTIQRSHAIANGVFVASVNRVGHEPSASGGIEFWGHSFVVDPSGRVIAEAGSGEEILVVDCDLSMIETQRRGWPFLRDRRTDAYGGITERWLGDADRSGADRSGADRADTAGVDDIGASDANQAADAKS
ncbi:MAG: carbon-nitrogen hydrolase [Polyangiaceae bacterium]|nr:carbon-nitrogen hydrolase [Polyangiaceae bacterium]